MHCPVCSSVDTKVVDSRPCGDGFGIRRRRECERCRQRFSTREEMEILDLMLQKRDGRREPYSRAKLEVGLKKALEKRPCQPEDLRALIGAIERDVQKNNKDQMTTEEIGETVMNHLKRFDAVAYLRFASVYRSFDDLRNFQEEMDRMTAKGNGRKR